MQLSALGLLLLEIMMLMLALASLLTDVGAFGGLVSMKARIAPCAPVSKMCRSSNQPRTTR